MCHLEQLTNFTAENTEIQKGKGTSLKSQLILVQFEQEASDLSSNTFPVSPDHSPLRLFLRGPSKLNYITFSVHHLWASVVHLLGNLK